MNGVFPPQPFGFGAFRAAFHVANRLQYPYCGALCALKSISNCTKRSFVTNVNRTYTENGLRFIIVAMVVEADRRNADALPAW